MAISPLLEIRIRISNLADRHFGLRRIEIASLGLFVRLEAPGKEKEVAPFLKQGLQMAIQSYKIDFFGLCRSWSWVPSLDARGGVLYTFPHARRS